MTIAEKIQYAADKKVVTFFKEGLFYLVTEMYENGIVVEKPLGYGGQTITMRLPFLSKESAIILFSKLDLSSFQNCWEPDIEFNQGFNGAIVRFSSGC